LVLLLQLWRFVKVLNLYDFEVYIFYNIFMQFWLDDINIS